MRSVRLLALAFVLVGCRPPGYGKGDDGPDPAVDAAPASDGTPGDDGSSAATCDKSFRLDGHGTASSVWLTGSFTNWGGDPANGAIAFTLGADGGWTLTHTFDAGSYQYKFIVNGNEWIIDPTNPDQADDGFGGKNSLYVCAP
ncbi:MAG TPA: hypothetical protein VFQ53_42775 [Kofleriaceae bacterium]|nr:hypothetical protein [Kofleriaceae bacterium]